MNVLFIAPIGLNTSKENFNAIHGGYGNATLNTLKILHLLKEEEKIDTLSVIDISQPEISEETIKSLLKEYDICICVVNPSQLVEDEIFYNFIKTYMNLAKKRYLQIVWETQNFPNSFDKLFNDETFTGFLSPSNWGCNELKNKTKKPIFYYPHFIDSNNFSLIDIDKKRNEKYFSVLFLGQYTYRKGIQDAIISFLRCLGNKDDCELILKFSMMSNKEVDPNIYLKSLIFCNSSPKELKANIKYIDYNISNEELGKLYDTSSVLLFPSRGEGFGLTCAEAMLQGLPVIYTNWSACKEVSESEFNYPITYTLDEAYNMMHYKYEYGLKYAVPSISNIMSKLEFLYDEWKKDKIKYYKKYQKNREIIENRYGVQASKKVILNILEGKNKFIKKEINLNEGFKSKETEFLGLNKFAEIGTDKQGFNWILRQNSFYDDILQDEIGANIEHEREILDEIKILSENYECFIDVGAHVGYYSIRLSKHFKEIYAIEPNINNYQGLLINVIINNIANIRGIPTPLYSEKKKLKLANNGSSSFLFNNDFKGSYYEIETDTFDNLFYENGNCIIKLDVEGSELNILKGAKNNLNFNNIWIIEWHNNLRKSIIEYMENYNFKIYKEFFDIKKIIFEKNK